MKSEAHVEIIFTNRYGGTCCIACPECVRAEVSFLLCKQSQEDTGNTPECQTLQAGLLVRGLHQDREISADMCISSQKLFGWFFFPCCANCKWHESVANRVSCLISWYCTYKVWGRGSNYTIRGSSFHHSEKKLLLES